MPQSARDLLLVPSQPRASIHANFQLQPKQVAQLVSDSWRL